MRGYSILVVNLRQVSPGTGGSGSAGRTGTVAAKVVDEQELEKVKNKFESHPDIRQHQLFECGNNLASTDCLAGRRTWKKVDRYRSVTAEQLRAVAQSAFRKENGVILYYKKQQN